MIYRAIPPVHVLHELFSYDHETGVLAWRVQRSNIKPGDVAGSVTVKRKYRTVGIDRSSFYVHRLIYTMCFGEIPQDQQIDHINGDKLDNRICNLRIATVSQNQANVSVRQDNSLNAKGVTRNTGRFSARIQINKTRIHIGRYKTVEAAAKAYEDAAKRYFGEFARAE